MIRFIILCGLIVFGALAVSAEVNLERDYYGYNASTDRYLAYVDSAITDARAKLTYILNDSLDYKPGIYIEDDIPSFRKRIGVIFPDWGAAAALPHKKMIVIKSPAHFSLGKSLRELVQHEYAHLALQERLFNADRPRWLDEGVAMYVAAEWGWSHNFTLSRAVVFRSLVPLGEIDDMNDFSEGKARTAYAESYMAVEYFIDQYGIELFNIFLDGIRRREKVDEALMEAIGATAEEFENEYFKHLEGRYNYMSLFGDLYFLWIILAAVVFGGYIYSFFKKRKYYKRWEMEEKYHSTDFDYGDPDNPERTDDEDEPWR